MQSIFLVTWNVVYTYTYVYIYVYVVVHVKNACHENLDKVSVTATSNPQTRPLLDTRRVCTKMIRQTSDIMQAALFLPASGFACRKYRAKCEEENVASRYSRKKARRIESTGLKKCITMERQGGKVHCVNGSTPWT